jgi:hypothetical protein
MRRERVQRFAFRVVSQTGINYRKSALSQSLDAIAKTAPDAGDRFPWLKLRFADGGPIEDSFRTFDDLHFHLVVAGQDDAPVLEGAGLSDLLRIHAIPADPANDAELTRARIPKPSFYLLRPDGHVGLCGGSFDAAAIRRYASERLRIAQA